MHNKWHTTTVKRYQLFSLWYESFLGLTFSSVKFFVRTILSHCMLKRQSNLFLLYKIVSDFRGLKFWEHFHHLVYLRIFFLCCCIYYWEFIWLEAALLRKTSWKHVKTTKFLSAKLVKIKEYSDKVPVINSSIIYTLNRNF